MSAENVEPDPEYSTPLSQLWPLAAAAGGLVLIGVAAFLGLRPGGFAPDGPAQVQSAPSGITAPGSNATATAIPDADINSKDCAELAGYVICNQVHADTQRRSAVIYGWWPEEGWVNEAGAELVEGAAPRLFHGFTLALDLDGVLHVQATSPLPAPTPQPTPQPFPDDWGIPSLVTC